MKNPILSIQGIKKQYPKTPEPALRGIDLDIGKGEFFGLLGPNGCGKSTLISIITGLLKPSSGNVMMNGKNVARARQSTKRFIGLVPQDLALYPSLTLLENLRFFGRLYGLHGSKLKERVNACVEVAQLKDFTGRPIKHFSGGMKRRANLAISLLHEPQILFLDEPTVNVDPQSRQVIFDLIKTLNEQGVTIIYTTHYLETAQQSSVSHCS